MSEDSGEGIFGLFRRRGKGRGKKEKPTTTQAPAEPHPYATASSTKPWYQAESTEQTPIGIKEPPWVKQAEAGEMPARTDWSSEVSAGQKAARSVSKRGQSLERRKQVLREWDPEAIRPATTTQTAPQEQPTQTAVSTPEYPTPPPALPEEERLKQLIVEGEQRVQAGYGIRGRGLPTKPAEQQPKPQEQQPPRITEKLPGARVLTFRPMQPPASPPPTEIQKSKLAAD